MSSCSKIRQDNTLMKIQMRPHLKFPSRGKPHGSRIPRRSRLPPAAKGGGAFLMGRKCLLRRRGEIFMRRAVRTAARGQSFFRAPARALGRRVSVRRAARNFRSGRGGERRNLRAVFCLLRVLRFFTCQISAKTQTFEHCGRVFRFLIGIIL